MIEPDHGSRDRITIPMNPPPSRDLLGSFGRRGPVLRVGKLRRSSTEGAPPPTGLGPGFLLIVSRKPLLHLRTRVKSLFKL